MCLWSEKLHKIFGQDATWYTMDLKDLAFIWNLTCEGKREIFGLKWPCRIKNNRPHKRRTLPWGQVISFWASLAPVSSQDAQSCWHRSSTLKSALFWLHLCQTETTSRGRMCIQVIVTFCLAEDRHITWLPAWWNLSPSAIQCPGTGNSSSLLAYRVQHLWRMDVAPWWACHHGTLHRVAAEAVGQNWLAASFAGDMKFVGEQWWRKNFSASFSQRVNECNSIIYMWQANGARSACWKLPWCVTRQLWFR